MEGLSVDLIKILDEFESQYDELNSLISRVEIASDSKLYSFYYKQLIRISPIVNYYKKYKKILDDINDSNNLKLDESENIEELVESLKTEKLNVENNIIELFERLQNLEKQKTRIEISSKENNLEFFELFTSVIKKFCANEEYNYIILKSTENSVTFQISGNGSYEKLKFANGLFKQIKAGKESKLIVVTLKELEQDIQIEENDFAIETLKSSGAGGQHINKTESAVRVTHIPTKISVKCEDERSQIQNKERAMLLIKNKLMQIYSKNSENYIKNQRNNMKNLIFSNTATCIFDFDKNKFIYLTAKKEIDINDILNGDFSKIYR